MMKKIVNSKFFVPGLISIFYVVIAFCCIDLSIWFDESYSSILIRGNFVDITELTAIDVHPPLYYYCLKIWSLIFGGSIVSLRAMSVFFGIIAIFGAYFLIKKLFNKKAASFSTFFLALSPLFVRYSEEARMYTMVVAIIIAATLFLVNAIRENKMRYWILYGIFVGLGMLTHYFSVFAFITHGIFLIYHFKKNVFKKEIIIAYGLAFLIFIPWLPTCLSQFNDVEGGFWIGEVSTGTILNYFAECLLFSQSGSTITNWAGFGIFLAIIVGIIFIVMYILKICKMGKSERKEFYILFGLLAALPPLLLVLLSMPPFEPLFVSRYVTYSACFFWVIIGLVLADLKFDRKNAVLFLSPFIILIAGNWHVLNRAEESDIRGLMGYISEESHGSSLVLADSESIYLDAIEYSNDKNSVYGIDEFYSYMWGSLEPLRRYNVNIVETLDDLPERDNVWIIFDKGSESDIEKYCSNDCIIDSIEGTSHIGVQVNW